ncbi:hypothetical protein [Streptosporangium sp. CA-115845]|uniref:hypothetical protein n=1 Tax=Streptosporangium sp. CA-115845 TaxID=3240071 RepID=UPI003D915393
MITLFPYLVFGAVMFLVGFGCCLAMVLVWHLLQHLRELPRPAEAAQADLWDDALRDLTAREGR